MTSSVVIRVKANSQGFQRGVVVQWNTVDLSAAKHLLVITDEEKKYFQPFILWHVNNEREQKLRVCCGRRLQFTVYGLEWSDTDQSFKIVSSDTATIHIVMKGPELRRPLNLGPHYFTRSVVGLCTISKVPCPLQMDPTQSHLLLSQRPAAAYGQVLLLCQRESPFEEKIMLKGTLLSDLQRKRKNLKTVFPSRTDLKLQVLTIFPKSDDLYRVKASSSVCKIRTYLNKADLQNLLQRACKYNEGENERIELHKFFRNKPRYYFDKIMNTKDGLMKVMKKDANGDKDSSINNNLYGMFFCATLEYDTKEPHPKSPFGERRLHIPARILFHERCNLYFADIFCHSNRSHTATLVMTEAGSEADEFCQACLLKLDPQDNPFLTRDSRNDIVYTKRAPRFYIEIFYTKDINIKELQKVYGDDLIKFTENGTLFSGESKINGIPKRSSCSTCNLP